ncbi:hypothetical protein JIR001_16770 [Polycladomyces abyssicola]|uniref:IDEAL domain-containing protein n=1 Tax=Polycladomyces abyssicola TaxID=1125966 RepID=A0A8D5UGL7_9BACL|nr:IDEAL domain-containing protein [Polycladomyces abyssicola]BCU81894.1 hypothetical protein JIR001_16770 [Polycladomyces abyssicola]
MDRGCCFDLTAGFGWGMWIECIWIRFGFMNRNVVGIIQELGKDVALAPDILHDEDRAALIDIALDMKDREWFYSLVK